MNVLVSMERHSISMFLSQLWIKKPTKVFSFFTDKRGEVDHSCESVRSPDISLPFKYRCSLWKMILFLNKTCRFPSVLLVVFLILALFWIYTSPVFATHSFSYTTSSNNGWYCVCFEYVANLCTSQDILVVLPAYSWWEMGRSYLTTYIEICILKFQEHFFRIPRLRNKPIAFSACYQTSPMYVSCVYSDWPWKWMINFPWMLPPLYSANQPPQAGHFQSSGYSAYS